MSRKLTELKDKKVLLIIHGTFSHCDSILKEIKSATIGDAWLSAAIDAYDHVLCFDHPTLSQSPVLNAFDLASRLAANVPASLDIVAHSRGGLVTRWFCEGFRQESLTCRAVLVGSPLAGTSIVAPARIKAVMDYLANVGDAVATVSSFGGGPFLAMAGTLAGIFAKVAGTLATPLADAIISLVPGFAAQSRESANAELRALRVNTGAYNFSTPGGRVFYSVIRSNFAPPPTGVWGFLKSFVASPGSTILGGAADFVFEGSNDLVVDTSSMDETGELPGPPAERAVAKSIAHFENSKTVHHCNYFQQPETLKAIRKAFEF